MILLRAETASDGLSSASAVNLFEFICGVTRNTPPLTVLLSIESESELPVVWDRGDPLPPPPSCGGVPTFKSFKKSSIFVFPEFLS